MNISYEDLKVLADHPTPWRVNDDGVLVDANDGFVMVRSYTEKSKLKYTLIMNAVNSYTRELWEARAKEYEINQWQYAGGGWVFGTKVRGVVRFPEAAVISINTGGAQWRARVKGVETVGIVNSLSDGFAAAEKALGIQP